MSSAPFDDIDRFLAHEADEAADAEGPSTGESHEAAGGEAAAVSVAPGPAGAVEVVIAPASVAGSAVSVLPPVPGPTGAFPGALAEGAAAMPVAAAAPPVPKPKPPIRPERTERGFATDGVVLERAGDKAWFVGIAPPGRPAQRIYVTQQALEQLLALAAAPVWEGGKLWSALADIPLERPLPNRRLEEELRALLMAFRGELRPLGSSTPLEPTSESRPRSPYAAYGDDEDDPPPPPPSPYRPLFRPIGRAGR